MIVKSVDFGKTIFLAPMAGYTDVGFRAVCHECGADATFTEMISAQALLYENQKTEQMLVTDEREGKVFVQIFGHDEKVMAEAVKNPLLQKFCGIDINMGCPANKIVKNGDGSSLLKDLVKAGKIVGTCAKEIGSRPLSVKVRLGYDKVDIANIVRMCQENGADFVTIHARTMAQGYSGQPDLESLSKGISVSKIPVIANGNVASEKDYKNMLSLGASGVMIARGAVGKPWIFSEIKGSEHGYYDLIASHVEILRKYYPEKWLTLYLRKHFLAYAASLKVGSEVKKQTALQTNIDDSLKLLKEAAKRFEN